MDNQTILAHLRALTERTPDWSQYNSQSRDHQVWLSQAVALVTRWNTVEGIGLKITINNLGSKNPFLWEHDLAKILQTVQNAIADLEFEVPPDEEVIFGPGSVYDFSRRLNEVIASAEQTIFIVDPYMDDTIFDHYLHSRSNNVTVRLLCNKYATANSAAAQKYNIQHGRVVEVRQCSNAHDRVVFIDGYVCFVIGQSLKDAAKAKPTYIAPLSPDVVPAKLQIYEQVWQSAAAI